MNILVIDRAPPCDLLQGNALIGQHLFRRLRHHHLTIICPAPASEHARYQAELASLFDTIHLVAREQPIPALIGSFEPESVPSTDICSWSTEFTIRWTFCLRMSRPFENSSMRWPLALAWSISRNMSGSVRASPPDNVTLLLGDTSENRSIALSRSCVPSSP